MQIFQPGCPERIVDLSLLEPNRFCASDASSAPLPAVRAALIAEDAAEWQKRFSPFIARGAQIDIFDSAMVALQAIAVTDCAPYGVILLGRQVQGMDASVLGAAIKTGPSCRDARLAVVGEFSDADAACFAACGFSAHIDKAASPEEVVATLERLWAAAGAPTLQHADTHFDTYRLLVADDNPVNQEVAKHLIEKLGCRCELARDGAQAVAMHAIQPYALILMDCEMPALDGYDATRCIRASGREGSQVPVIALTASSDDDEREKCMAAGMNDFLSKPLRAQTLKDMLARWLPVTSIDQAVPAAVPCEDELEAIQAMFGADFAELTALYKKDGLPRLTALHEAYAAADSARVAKVAHAFSGSSASIGATGLSALCKDLEMRAKAGTIEGFMERISEIEAEYRRISDKLALMLHLEEETDEQSQQGSKDPDCRR